MKKLTLVHARLAFLCKLSLVHVRLAFLSNLRFLLCQFDDFNDGVGSLDHIIHGDKLKFAVEIFAACKDIWCWQSHVRKLRAIGAAADWFDNWLNV